MKCPKHDVEMEEKFESWGSDMKDVCAKCEEEKQIGFVPKGNEQKKSNRRCGW